jgi:hypothetical protein
LRHIKLFCLALTLLACEHYPSNPEIKADLRLVRIDHLSTRYVPIDPPVDGLVARKVNILEFSVAVENLTTSALEFRGKAVISGPPETKEHAFRFRTDRLDPVVPDAGVPFAVFASIDTGTAYVFYRFQIPMNEYSPFAQGQGMVTALTIDEVFAIDERGASCRVPFSSGEIQP